MLKYVLVILYVAVLLGVGIYSRKYAHSTKDFFLGGRQIGPIFSAFAFGTTYFSAVVIINAGKIGWGYGMACLWIVATNVLIGVILAWVLLGKRTWAMTNRMNVMTMPDFLKARYKDEKFKIVAALVIFIFLVPYSATVFMGLSYIFEAVFSIPYTYALVFMTLITAIYLTMGGYKAIALADSIQGVIMIVGAVIMAYFITQNDVVGGFGEGVSRLRDLDVNFVKVFPGGWPVLISICIFSSFGVWGMPQMVQKFYAVKKASFFSTATIVCSIFAFIILFCCYINGVFSHLYFSSPPIDAGTGLPNPDLISPQMIITALPQAAIAIILLLILSASMSTLASLVLVASSSLSMDLLKGYIRPNMRDKNVTRVMQALCVIFVLLSCVIALLKPASILSIQSVSWGAVAGFFIGPYVFGLFWRRTTRIGAWAGSITGLVVAIVPIILFDTNSSVASAIAILLPLVVTPLVSLVTPQLPQDIINRAFEAPKERAEPKSVTS